MRYIKYFLMIGMFMSVITLGPHKSEAGVLREAGRGCLMGGTVLAVTTYIGITPALIYPAGTLAGSTILANNSLIGCGIFAAGMAAGSIWETIYDFFF